MAKVIHGTTAKCIEHFSAENKFERADKEACITRNKVCDLLDIGYDVGHAWFDDMTMPKGVNMLKLQILLELLGYVTKERAKLTDLQLRIGACLVLSQATVKELREFVDVKDKTLLRWACGETQPLEEKVPVIEGALKLYEAEMVKTLARWKETIKVIGLKSPHERIAEPKSDDVPHDQVVERVASLVRELAPLASRLVSDEFTAKDRLRLRELTALQGHNHSVFELSTHLNCLCGEKARDELS